MSGRHLSISRRLEMIEQQIAAAKERLDDRAGCICREVTVVFNPEQFEAETALKCPRHGLRRFGQLMIINFVNPDQTLPEKSVELHRLIDVYNLRLQADDARRVQERTG